MTAPADLFPPLPQAVKVRPRQEVDLAAIVALAQRVYPAPIHGPEAGWPLESLRAHLQVFPEGQFVAVEVGGRVLGDATSLRVSWGEALRAHTWMSITGGGPLANHQPQGEVFYGVDIMVDPSHQGQGIGARLYATRLAAARAMGCRAFVAGARIPGYARVASALTPEAYVTEVAEGRRFDPTLTRQLRHGFQVRGLLPNYFEDAESCNFAALIVLEFL